MDETGLIRRVRAGEPAAERALYDAHVDRVYRLAYRMTGDDDLARDCTQETFIRAFDRLDQFRGEAVIGTWLTAIATSVVLNALRKVKRFRREHRDPRVRKQAIFWLGRSGDPRALVLLEELLTTPTP